MGFTRQSAFHEAGHALISLRMCESLVSTSIDADGCGLTRSGPVPDYHKRLCLFCAGEVSENILGTGSLGYSARDDRAQATELIANARWMRVREIADPWQTPDGRRAWSETEAMLRRYRHHVATIAEKLWLNTYLSGADVSRIVAGLPDAAPANTGEVPLSVLRRRVTLNARERRYNEQCAASFRSVAR